MKRSSNRNKANASLKKLIELKVNVSYYSTLFSIKDVGKLTSTSKPNVKARTKSAAFWRAFSSSVSGEF